MITSNLKKTLIFSLFIVMIFTSCSDSNDDSQTEPVLIENYYFRGTLDGEVLNIERNIYESILDFDPNTLSIDFGGSQTDDDEVFGEPGTGYCYGRYACGLLFSSSQENPDQLDTAKMYFSRIPVGECTLENELIAMNSFFELNNYEYETFPRNGLINIVALDFFPGEYENQEVYYSSRFGDNTDASFTIISINEEESGVFLVEGNFNCKLYKFNEATEFKVLQNGEFKIKIRSNLEE